MAEGPAIGTHRFDGQSLQTMYSWMHEQGNGPGSAETARAALVQLGTLLSDVESQMRTALSGIGIEWEGAAAAAAGEAIRQSANWVADAGQISMTFCRPAADQGEAFTTTRSQIQQPVSAEYGFGDVMADGFNIASDIAIGPLNPFEVQTDVDHAAKQNAAHHAAAVQAMTVWNSAAQTNLAAMTPVDAPQPIVVQAAAAGATRQPTVGDGGSTPLGTAGGAGQSGVPSPVAAQQLGSAAAFTPGTGPGPLPTGSAGSGGAAAPFLPPAPTPAQSAGAAPRPGTAVPGFGAGLGPAAAGTSDRLRHGPGDAAVPGGRGGTGQGGVVHPGRPGIAHLGPGAAGLAAGEGFARAGSATQGVAGRGAGSGSFLQPAAAGTRSGHEDDEHQNKYWQKDSGIFEDNRLVAPPVIGEDPQQ